LFVSGDEIVSATAYSILRSIGTNVSAAVPILVERLKDCETLPGDFRKDSESAGKEIGIIDFLPNLLNKLPFDETTAARDRLDKCSMSRNREMRERASAAIDRLRKPK
jgi:antitoxin component of RelBE/YafQ-DinJ toxin-antitoxin module